MAESFSDFDMDRFEDTIRDLPDDDLEGLRYQLERNRVMADQKEEKQQKMDVVEKELD